MFKNQLLRHNDLVYRVLQIKDNQALVINCKSLNVPTWVQSNKLDRFEEISQEDLLIINNIEMPLLEQLSIKERKTVQDKFASIGPLLPLIGNESDRNDAISYISNKLGINRRTIIRRLCRFLVYQDVCIYVASTKRPERSLTPDQMNFRCILNKYFYTRQKRSLKSCYLLLIREKYPNKDKYPSFSQFKHYYYKTRRLDSAYISREGRSEYDRNIRPLLGNSRDYFNTVGFGLTDNTTLDLYVLDNSGKAKRPYLSAMVDGYSGLCLGFAIGFEGGDVLLRKLIHNVGSNKVEYSKSIGIYIDENEWPSKGLPYVIVTDNGSDFTGSSFTQLTQLGIQIQTNKTHSPHLKPNIERFFGIIQSIIKPYLYKSGLVGKDNNPENPKDNACLSLKDIEKILCRAIIFYNSKRIITLPYGKEHLKPYSNELFIDSFKEYPNTFISASDELVRLTMLPRTKGKMTRFGLKVGKLFYRCYGFVNDFIEAKKEEIVVYDPNNVGSVWLIREKYIEFTLIDKYFDGKGINEVDEVIEEHRRNQLKYRGESIASEIRLGEEIEEIVNKGGKKK